MLTTNKTHLDHSCLQNADIIDLHDKCIVNENIDADFKCAKRCSECPQYIERIEYSNGPYYETNFSGTFLSIDTITNREEYLEAIRTPNVIHLLLNDIDIDVNPMVDELLSVIIIGVANATPCVSENKSPKSQVHVSIRKKNDSYDNITFSLECKYSDSNYECYIAQKRTVYFKNNENYLYDNVNHSLLAYLEYKIIDNTVVTSGIFINTTRASLLESVNLYMKGVICRAAICAGFVVTNDSVSRIIRCSLIGCGLNNYDFIIQGTGNVYDGIGGFIAEQDGIAMYCKLRLEHYKNVHIISGSNTVKEIIGGFCGYTGGISKVEKCKLEMFNNLCIIIGFKNLEDDETNSNNIGVVDTSRGITSFGGFVGINWGNIAECSGIIACNDEVVIGGKIIYDQNNNNDVDNKKIGIIYNNDTDHENWNGIGGFCGTIYGNVSKSSIKFYKNTDVMVGIKVSTNKLINNSHICTINQTKIIGSPYAVAFGFGGFAGLISDFKIDDCICDCSNNVKLFVGLKAELENVGNNNVIGSVNESGCDFNIVGFGGFIGLSGSYEFNSIKNCKLLITDCQEGVHVGINVAIKNLGNNNIVGCVGAGIDTTDDYFTGIGGFIGCAAAFDNTQIIMKNCCGLYDNANCVMIGAKTHVDNINETKNNTENTNVIAVLGSSETDNKGNTGIGGFCGSAHGNTKVILTACNVAFKNGCGAAVGNIICNNDINKIKKKGKYLNSLKQQVNISLNGGIGGYCGYANNMAFVANNFIYNSKIYDVLVYKSYLATNVHMDRFIGVMI